MTIITSQPPYRDDFDKDKGYYRVLYRPGYPVQARELTQQQTALQYQIEKFGRHIFDEGSIVTGGQFDIDLTFPYVLLSPENQVGNYVNPISFINKTIQGATSGVKAKIITVEQVVRDGVVYFVAMIRYVAGSASTDASLFTPGETAFDVDNSLSTIKIRTEAFGAIPVLGKGSLFTIEEGVVFSHGLFVDFARQSIILDPFSITPSCRIGFEIDINVISSTDDETLLDNANGTPNYNAPGADRLQVKASLKKIDLDDVASLPTFVEAFTIKDGVVQVKYERPQYAVIGDEIAKRTYDESGDYTLRGHGIRTREHLDTGINEGYLTLDNGGNSSLLAIDIEPGLSYVKGYEVETLVTQHISTPKSTTYEYVNQQIISARSSNYIIVEEVVGLPVLDEGTQVDLYCSGGDSPDIGEKRITNVIPSTTSPTGHLIGTARVKSVAYESGILGTPSGRLRIYLYDIKMNGACGGIPNVRSIHCSTPTDFFADVVLNSITGIAEFQQRYFQPLLYPLGTDFTRTIRSSNDLSDTSFIFQRTVQNLLLAADGTLNVTLGTSLEQYAYGEGTLSSTEKLNIFVVLEEAASVTLPGKVQGTLGQNTLTQYLTNTTHFTRLNVGDKIEIADVTDTYIITTISSDSTLTVDRPFTSSFSNKTFEKVYYAGDHLNLNLIGSAAGTTRTATVDVSSRNLAIDIKETLDNQKYVSISFLVSRNTAFEIKKLLYTNRFVRIDCSAISAESPPVLTDPINLGISDVFRIHSIRKKSGSTFASSEEGTDVTDQFIFNNGQLDDFYDHASIQLRSGYTLSETDHLLIELDFFEPDFTQGVGYFSVDSYPVDDTKITSTTIFTHEIPIYKSPETGNIYNLRDYLDFRSVKQNTAANSTTIAGSTQNPAASSDFKKAPNGLRLAFPSTSIYVDYSYYLARRDVVVANPNGTFDVIKGIPAVFPVTPQILETVMGIAQVYIPPYPSISSTYGRILGRTDLACRVDSVTFERHTMRDIGVLKSRIKNLEYYTSINLLEKQTNDLVITDENGLDRFKNGFFIDPFVDHSLGDTTNADYKIAIDRVETCLRPFYMMESVKYQYLPIQSTNVQLTNSLVTLPYTEVSFIEQLKATSRRNIEQSVFRYIGNLTMRPDTDIWVDTSTYDKTIQQDFSFEGTDQETILSSEWGAWSDYITGYNVYDRRINDRSGTIDPKYYIGSYSSYADAVAAGQRYDPAGSGKDRYLIQTEQSEQRTLTTVKQKLTYTDETLTQKLGTFVTDVSLATYIKPQAILIHAKGLKAHTAFNVFFDNENMNNYVIPYVIPDGWNGNLNTLTFSVAIPTGPKTLGSQLKSDAYGDLVFHLILPKTGKKFRIGTKEVKITDSPTNAIDATSYAIGYFVAHGLIQQKQNTVLSTKHTIVQTDIEKETSTETRKKQSVEIVGPSCMAYSFYVQAPKDQDGVFLTSVDVWIESVDTANKLGVWFEIREMNSAGGITRTQVPYSEVWMKWNDSRIKATSDASEYTRVNFENPVFLLNNTQYAFIIHTEGLNPNTYFWVSRLGESDLVTGKQVTSRQLTGNVYTTNNNLNWDIVPDIDLKVRFNRAKFQTGTGTAMFGNVATEFLTVTNRSDAFVQYGERIIGSEKLTLGSFAGTETIEVGDVIIGSSSLKSGNVLAISGNTYFTDQNGFISGETITVQSGSPLSLKDSTATISLINYGLATLDSFNRRTNKMVLSESNGHFFAGSKIIGETSAETAEIVSTDDFYYSTIQFNPNNLVFTNTSIDYSLREIITSSDSYSSYLNVLARTDNHFDTQRSLLSRSNEVIRHSGNVSAQAKCVLTSSSEWVSPVIDINRTSGVFVYNIINDDTTNETNPSGGNLKNKYISKIVTLAKGQDAEDLLVSLTAYVPPRITDDYPVKVWAKILNNEDGDLFINKPWIEMIRSGDTIYSSEKNVNDYRALDFKFPAETISNDEIRPGVQYVANENTYTGFKQFAVKIGLLGNEGDTAIVPKVADLRVIALQM